MDEDTLELDLSEEVPNRTEERIKNLSSKVREKATEAAEAQKKAEEAETARLAAEKERDFYASFSTSTAKFPAASEHMDAIKEKVLSGYSVEDATVAVLNAEGKLVPQEATPAPVESPLGGSAATPSLDVPSSQELSLEEKRAKLMEADQRGEIQDALRALAGK